MVLFTLLQHQKICSFSITTDGSNSDPKILKINGKKVSSDSIPYRSFHNHEPLNGAQCTQILCYDRIKSRVISENLPITKIYEDSVPAFETKKSSLYRANGKSIQNYQQAWMSWFLI